MSAHALGRLVTGTTVGLIVLGVGLVAFPFAEPEPDPVRIERVRAVGGDTRVDLRVLRPGRLSVEIRTQAGEPVRAQLPEQPILPGNLSVRWDGRLDSGEEAPPDAYVVRATAYPGLRPYTVERNVRVGT